ncbi:hypothetical protein D3C78_1468400 [compost metagenome]
MSAGAWQAFRLEAWQSENRALRGAFHVRGKESFLVYTRGASAYIDPDHRLRANNCLGAAAEPVTHGRPAACMACVFAAWWGGSCAGW